MFGSKKRAEARAAERQRVAAQQQVELAAKLDELIDLARTFPGATAADLDGDTGRFMLTSGERIYGMFQGASLIEPRSGGGEWKGRSQGISVPLAYGIRYRIGASKGHYVKNPDVPTAIDTGDVMVTNQRVVFAGSKQTREWSWSKCVSIDHRSDAPWTAIGVSNRQKISGVLYDDAHATDVRFRIDFAHAVYANSVDTFIAHLEHERAAVVLPAAAPASLPSAATPPPPPPPPAPVG